MQTQCKEMVDRALCKCWMFTQGFRTPVGESFQRNFKMIFMIARKRKRNKKMSLIICSSQINKEEVQKVFLELLKDPAMKQKVLMALLADGAQNDNS